MTPDHNEIVWSSMEASVVTGGQSSSEWRASGISMNINEVKPGDLFVASAEDDLDQVFKKGAAAVMVPRGAATSDLIPTLEVPGIFEALKGLARAARFRTHANVITVQGREARGQIENMLAAAGSVHKCGRHLSLGLAGLPADVEYGVYGASPAVEPDIAIITDAQTATRDTLFELMPNAGCVIVNADDENFLSVVARAKAAGIDQVYTYGDSEYADARLLDMMAADNGVRVSTLVMGEEYTFQMPKGFEVCAAFLPALLTLKITDKCLSSVMKVLGAHTEYSAGKEGVMLIDPALSQKHEAVFRITNMIDFGFGNQTAVLDNLSSPADKSLTMKKGFAIPGKLANLNFVYTSKGIGAVANAKAIIRERHKNVRIEPIIPDVAVPGDFLVFKDILSSSKAALSEALRIVPEGKRPKNAL